MSVCLFSRPSVRHTLVALSKRSLFWVISGNLLSEIVEFFQMLVALTAVQVSNKGELKSVIISELVGKLIFLWPPTALN